MGLFGNLFSPGSRKYNYANTRQYLRLPAVWPVKFEPISLSPASPENPQVLRTRDVSAGGVAVVSREKIPVGSRIRVEVHVPLLDRSFSAEGHVVRCLALRDGQFDLGIRFDRIESATQAALNAAIEKYYGPDKDRQLRGTWRRNIP